MIALLAANIAVTCPVRPVAQAALFSFIGKADRVSALSACAGRMA
jgi:hypothetical protein